MPEITPALLSILAALLGWGFRLAYRAGVVMTVLEQRVQSHEVRITALEGRAPPSPRGVRLHAPPSQ